MGGLARAYGNEGERETQFANLSAELQSVRAQLRDARGPLGDAGLTGRIAHDFGNLLGVIIANLDLLDEGIDKGTENSTLLHEALEAALRGAELNRQLLALTRRTPLTPTRIDASGVLRRLAEGMRNDSEAAHIELELDLESNAPVAADPIELEARIAALLDRARNAMPKGGTLSVSTASRKLGAGNTPFAAPLVGDYVIIEIGDTGAALTQEEIARALSPTLRLSGPPDASATAFHEVSTFARQSHGYVDIQAQKETGTIVRLYLPRDGEPLAGADKSATEAPATETVLVVDDNADMRRVVVRQLRELGYNVLEAEDGPSALMTLNSATVDLLFTDVVMPGGLSGFDLARLVTSRWPRMKALITSGFPELEPHGESAAQAKLRRLNKPYRKSDLALTLREVLDS